MVPRALLLALINVVALGAATRVPAHLEPLREAINQWSHETEAWAFTVRVREHDDTGPIRTRVERYDPSRGEAKRWTLVAVNDRAPTEKEIAAFQKRKGAKKQLRTKPPSDYVDFERVAILAEDADFIQFSVPLREDISLLIPLEQLTVLITVDRATGVVRHLAIHLEEPMRIAFGLLRVTDLNFDLRFASPGGEPGDVTAGACPTGVAEASVSTFDVRAEFSWSDFERVRLPEVSSAEAAPVPPDRPHRVSDP